MSTVRPIAWKVGIRYSLWHLVRCNEATFVPDAPITMCGALLPDGPAKSPVEDRAIRLDETCSRCLTRFQEGRDA